MAGRGIHLPPERRHTGMVFQEYARFPYLTVAKNVAFGMPQQQMAQLLVDLSEQASRYPHLLSGEQQRTALAPSPHILLLDEPFSCLDQNTHPRLNQRDSKNRRTNRATGDIVYRKQR